VSVAIAPVQLVTVIKEAKGRRERAAIRVGKEGKRNDWITER
jgi:hypothetical protein